MSITRCTGESPYKVRPFSEEEEKLCHETCDKNSIAEPKDSTTIFIPRYTSPYPRDESQKHLYKASDKIDAAEEKNPTTGRSYRSNTPHPRLGFMHRHVERPLVANPSLLKTDALATTIKTSEEDGRKSLPTTTSPPLSERKFAWKNDG